MFDLESVHLILIQSFISRWLVNSDIYNYFGTDREVCGRAVIYGGISQVSQGIKFINAVEFLLNIG